MKKKNNDRSGQWFKLDNAAKLFPGQNSSSWSNVIRTSVNLDREIDPTILKQALENTMPRFPALAVRIRRGLFWYYFEKNNDFPEIKPDANNPCLRIKYKENNRFLFRVFYYRNRLSLELFHALTDGYGSSVFLLTLAAEYLRLCGEDIPYGGMVLDPKEEPKEAELEDSFHKYVAPVAKEKTLVQKTYHRTGEKLPVHTSHITIGYMPVAEVIKKAKSYGVTVTEYFASILTLIHIKLQKEENLRQKEVSIQIPVNCRNQFPSETLRNFSVCYSVRTDPNMGDYTFEEILRQVSLYLRYTNNRKHLQSIFAANVGFEKNPVMRFLPLSVKNFAIGVAFAFTAECTTTSLFTNLGKITVPPEMEKHIESCILMPSPGKVNGGRIGAVTLGDKMTVAFADCYKDKKIEREFFRFLVKEGIPVKIETNY